MSNSELKILAIKKFPFYPTEVIDSAMKYLTDRKRYSILYKETDKRIEEVFSYIHWVSKMNT